MNEPIATYFSEGLKSLNLSLDKASQQKLLEFLELLKKWNRSYNLTSITEDQKMITHHLLDSLAISPYIVGKTVLDVGSGAGFPGIPLAVYLPQVHWTLLDSNGKKTSFLNQAKLVLSLPNISVVQARAEQWHPAQKFDLIVVRAVGAITEVMSKTRHLLDSQGFWFFMQSEHQYEQLKQFHPAAIVHNFYIPGIPNPRHLVIVPALANISPL